MATRFDSYEEPDDRQARFDADRVIGVVGRSKVSDKETAPKTKPYHPWLIGKLRGSPEQCAHYLLAAARDSEEMFLVALKNINEAFAVECTAQALRADRFALRCPHCNKEKANSADAGGNKMCFHCGDCGFAECEWSSPAHEYFTDKATPQGTPDTQWIKPKFPATTPEEWREFGKTLTSPTECPQCGSKDFWTVLPACHGGKAHKWHAKEK